jgi:hypothetical protein
MHAMRCWQIFEPLLLFEVSKQKTKAKIVSPLSL